MNVTEYGCIGRKLPHSFSKTIHEMFGEYSYELIELEADEVGAFMTKHDFTAINVTIPYKETVIPYLDEISDTAKNIGAVNTVVNRNGRLYGFNTDFFGMKSLIEKNGIDVSGRKVIITGSGGTSKTACAVVSSLGADKIIQVSRSGKNGAVTYDELYEKHTDADIIINTTPVGMYPDIFASPVDISRFTKLCGVIDAVYNPLTTMLVSDAKKRGITADCGLYMLTAQAVKAYEIFTDKTAGIKLTDDVFNKVIAEKRNIVLIGMPSCGKTTVGQALADKLGRKFIDTDCEIIKETGMPIADFFKLYGEKAFRNTETEIIRKISPMSGVVIATGGGAVLREENTDALKMNGTLYFLDRPPELLCPTSDRPLASSSEALKRLYSERYSIYRSSADVIINADSSIEDTVSATERKHYGI